MRSTLEFARKRRYICPGSVMAVQQVRAVIRRVDRETLKTEWFPLGSLQVVEALMKLLPLNGEDFMVIWEEREIKAKARSSAG
jgi:hypothetical protein